VGYGWVMKLLRMAENCRKLLCAGVTTARDLGGRDFLEIELRNAIETGLAVGPHLVVATRPITNTGGHCWYMGGEADTEEDIRRVARENLAASTRASAPTSSRYAVIPSPSSTTCGRCDSSWSPAARSPRPG
jgi:imidazolonepropionase-like amidohydrolase